MNFKTKLAIRLGKLSKNLINIVGRKGTHIPGQIALKIDPNLYSNIDKRENIIVVTGTNGKTSTSNLIADSLKSLNVPISYNGLGSNTGPGIAATMIDTINESGLKTSIDTSIFEIDELWLRKIIPNFQISTLTVTNLFQDSYERNANLYFMFNRINSAIIPGTKLILNASDAISSQLGDESNPRVYFNVDIMDYEEEYIDSKIKEAIYCPICDSPLEWDFKRYLNIGKYHCNKCGYRNPEASYIVKNIDRENNELLVLDHGIEVKLNLVQDRIENVYNQIAAYATLRENGYSIGELKEAMDGISIVKSRFYDMEIANKSIASIVAKGYNPVASSLVLYRLGLEKRKKTVIYLVDDSSIRDYSDRNMGWLFSTDFKNIDNEYLNNFILCTKKDPVIKFVCALDGFNMNKFKMADTLDDVIKYINPDSKEVIYILHDIEDENIAIEKELIKKLREHLE